MGKMLCRLDEPDPIVDEEHGAADNVQSINAVEWMEGVVVLRAGES